MPIQTAPPPHPAGAEDEELLRACRVERGRVGGPGGQRRNRVETAIRIVHEPTGVEAGASERREQAENLRVATFRLRLALAREVRTPRDLIAGPSDLWRSRTHGGRIACNERHADFPTLLAEALDVLYIKRDDPKPAAILLGVTPSQLVRFVGKDPPALASVNERRALRGLHAFK